MVRHVFTFTRTSDGAGISASLHWNNIKINNFDFLPLTVTGQDIYQLVKMQYNPADMTNNIYIQLSSRQRILRPTDKINNIIRSMNNPARVVKRIKNGRFAENRPPMPEYDPLHNGPALSVSHFVENYTTFTSLQEQCVSRKIPCTRKTPYPAGIVCKGTNSLPLILLGTFYRDPHLEWWTHILNLEKARLVHILTNLESGTRWNLQQLPRLRCESFKRIQENQNILNLFKT
jgi:hypothetical protein